MRIDGSKSHNSLTQTTIYKLPNSKLPWYALQIKPFGESMMYTFIRTYIVYKYGYNNTEYRNARLPRQNTIKYTAFYWCVRVLQWRFGWRCWWIHVVFLTKRYHHYILCVPSMSTTRHILPSIQNSSSNSSRGNNNVNNNPIIATEYDNVMMAQFSTLHATIHRMIAGFSTNSHLIECFIALFTRILCECQIRQTDWLIWIFIFGYNNAARTMTDRWVGDGGPWPCYAVIAAAVYYGSSGINSKTPRTFGNHNTMKRSSGRLPDYRLSRHNVIAIACSSALSLIRD